MENGMSRVACRYSIVRFLPYPETGEFANVGVVITCPETGYFDFKLQSRRYSRITDFFAELDSKVYLESVKLFRLELERIRKQLITQRIDPSSMRKLFDSLTHPREAIVKLTEARPRLSEDPKQTLEKLFNYYVERDFVTHEYRDTVVTKRVKAIVDSLKLDHPFKPETLGDEFVSAHFPLVQHAKQDSIDKVIKPFALNHSEPAKIIQHGASWLDRVRRLRKKGALPQRILFAIEGPSPNDEKCEIAFQEICEELKQEVLVLAATDHPNIAKFALGS